MAATKRKLDSQDDGHIDRASVSKSTDQAEGPVAKHRRTTSASDFSTYDIKHALDMPAAGLNPPQDLVDQVSKVTPPDLLGLLDLTTLNSIEDISARYEEIAAELLHGYVIEITNGAKTEQLQILELEFYLYKSGSHEDPFTHASAEQSQAGRWYFHRPPRRSDDPAAGSATPSGYRGGTRKGLDITIGQPPPSASSKYFQQAGSGSEAKQAVLRGGILLRSVRRVSDSKVISGPSLSVDEVLRLSGAREIAQLVAENWDGDISAFPPAAGAHASTAPPQKTSTMYLRRVAPPAVRAKSSSKARIYRSPRIGLDVSHPSIPSAPAAALAHPRVRFIAQPYRFFAQPHLLTANGRGQTFLGVYDALQGRGETDEEMLAELCRLTGVKGPTAGKYLAALRAGLREGKLGAWIGPKGKTVLSSVMNWLEMMGTLRRLQATTAAAAT